MSNKRPVVCAYCNEVIETGQATKHSSKYYHQHCLEQYLDEKDKNKKVKCKYCSEQLRKEEAINYQGSYYHRDCYEHERKRVEDYNELVGYIYKMYGFKTKAECDASDSDYDLGKQHEKMKYITSQIHQFKNDYGYTYKGMKLTLEYFFDIMENPVLEDSGIGIIPYVYEEAKEFHRRQIALKKQLADISEPFVTHKTITIKRPVYIPPKPFLPDIDISTL